MFQAASCYPDVVQGYKFPLFFQFLFTQSKPFVSLWQACVEHPGGSRTLNHSMTRRPANGGHSGRRGTSGDGTGAETILVVA